ncbi:MAG TPA: (E)-4-hydroxy-3-methylbut-2-enyl-diphosphate synthase [Chitinophagaceae bacterium]|nr:(E)-4-hydroxy-3-methylbut-2-enyl-diphosphate synthase [Chitinophagaceae bacterium]
MQFYCESLTEYKRLKTKEVKIGDLLLGNPDGYRGHPIRVQTMTTTDTMDTLATVEQSIRCIEAGAELIRITAPSKNDAENLLHIKSELRKRGYHTPLVADIHFTPNAAEIAARIVEKVRVNPGNYVDKKKFELIEYSDADYAEEIDRIRERFTPLIKICKEYGTAMRIGTNHGSLSDRIMSRYGDTAMGMVESAMEFLRIARNESYHNIVLSMKSSNPQVMVQAYRLLVKTMFDEFAECYPLHLGVTEAGDGEDGRIKSAVGIGTLLEDGLGDTIRVSLTEDPELEIPVCKDLVKRYDSQQSTVDSSRPIPAIDKLSYDPFRYQRRETFEVDNIGAKHVPVVIADLSKIEKISATQLESVGYTYDEATDKWNISDAAADYIFTGNQILDFALPGTLKVIVYPETWQKAAKASPVGGGLVGAKYFPIYQDSGYVESAIKSDQTNFVMIDCFNDGADSFTYLDQLANDLTVVLCLSSTNNNAMQSVRRMYVELINRGIKNPVINITDSPDNNREQTADEHLIHFATENGGLLLEGFGDGICLGMTSKSYSLLASSYKQLNATGRNYSNNLTIEQFINSTSFGILQATRTRISKTEYISCPSCGRTLFDLQETTAKIRSRTNHLKGVKIAIMGCIVNGPGEMADADFGYVGSGPGKITLYRGKEIVKRNVNSEVAVDELINLLKESEAWLEPG